jgi:hypothetical protein
MWALRRNKLLNDKRRAPSSDYSARLGVDKRDAALRKYLATNPLFANASTNCDYFDYVLVLG